jgi:hypothetical protein
MQRTLEVSVSGMKVGLLLLTYLSLCVLVILEILGVKR